MEREFIEVADKNAIDDAADKNVVKWKESSGNTRFSLCYVEITEKNVVKWK